MLNYSLNCTSLGPIWNNIACIVRQAWLTFLKNLLIHVQTFKMKRQKKILKMPENFNWAMTLRKSVVLEIAKTKTSKAFVSSKHIFKTHFGIIWNSHRNTVSICQSTYCYYKQKVSFDMLLRFTWDQTYIFFYSACRAIDWKTDMLKSWKMLCKVEKNCIETPEWDVESFGALHNLFARQNLVGFQVLLWKLI